MASLVDSIKGVVQDSHPFFKIAGFSFVIFVVVQLTSYDNVSPFFKFLATALTFFAFFGFMLESLSNLANEENIVMPGLLNPLRLIMQGIKGTLSLLPCLALVYYGMNWFISVFTFVPWVNYILLTIVFVVLLSFFVVSLLLYVKKYNPIASYNFKNIFKYSGDFIVYNFVLVVNVIILLGVVFFPIGIFVKLVFNYGLVFEYYLIFTIVFTIMVMLHYYAQLYFEYIDLSDT